jgi:hypothetical protein
VIASSEYNMAACQFNQSTATDVQSRPCAGFKSKHHCCAQRRERDRNSEAAARMPAILGWHQVQYCRRGQRERKNVHDNRQDQKGQTQYPDLGHASREQASIRLTT